MEKENDVKIIKCSELEPKEFENIFLQFTRDRLEENSLRGLEKGYPNILKWFKEKVCSDFQLRENREILLAMLPLEQNIKFVGFAILKDTVEEKKICTIRIDEEHQKKGIGEKLFRKAFEVLKTKRPLITVSEENEECFKNLFEKFNFEKKEEKKDLYAKGIKENIYNGYLK